MTRCLFSTIVIAASIGALASCNTTRGTAGYEGTRDHARVLDADAAPQGDGSSGSAEAPVPVAFPVKGTTELNVVQKYDVGGDWMCVGFGNLWEPSGGKLNRVDPETHQVLAKIPVAANFCHPAPDGNFMWVASVGGGTVSKIDIATNTVVGTWPVKITSGSEGSFAVTANAVWVVTSNNGTNAGTLTRLDATTGAIVADVKIADDSHGIAAEGKYVWVTSYSGNAVTQVDAETNAVINTIKVDEGPRFISGGEHGVWVMSQGTGNVTRIDPVTGAIVAVIDAKNPGFGGDISAGNGGVFVTRFGTPVTHIDAATNKVVAAYQGSGFGDAIRAGAGYVFVSGGKLTQIKF